MVEEWPLRFGESSPKPCWSVPKACHRVSLYMSQFAEGRLGSGHTQEVWHQGPVDFRWISAGQTLFRLSFPVSYWCWLVVWNMFYCPILGIIIRNNHPNWLICFSWVETTNQGGFGKAISGWPGCNFHGSIRGKDAMEESVKFTWFHMFGGSPHVNGDSRMVSRFGDSLDTIYPLVI